MVRGLRYHAPDGLAVGETDEDGLCAGGAAAAPNLVASGVSGLVVDLSCLVEFLQSALVRGGFTGVQLAVVTRLLANYVIGAALTEATWRHTSDPKRRGPRARRHIAANRSAYPTLIASGHLDDRQWSDDDLFEHGIDAILRRDSWKHRYTVLSTGRSGTPRAALARTTSRWIVR